jgi:predicted pyridoxine 5'-phosphate oxidase superfamily flavin-nucleotide-binding protein
MATVAENGWPYMQHRGGAPGFLRVLDDRTLGFADFRGNRQYISVGNLSVDDRAALFLMDYANRARLKILGHVEVKDLKDDPDLAAKWRCLDTKRRSSVRCSSICKTSIGIARSISRRASRRPS